MKIGRPFYLHGLKDGDDKLVPISFKCGMCKKPTKAIMIDVLLSEVYGRKLCCSKCWGQQWEIAMMTLGKERRDNRRKMRVVKFTLYK